MFVQIVKFKLKPDASRESFVKMTQQMLGWLKSRAGFIAYELYEGAEYWSDRIVWEDQACAENGLKEFLKTDIAQQMIHLIEDDYNSFFGQAVIATD